MFRILKSVLSVAAIFGLTASVAVAQGYRDAGAKARGEYGTGFHSSGFRSMSSYRAAPMYAAPAPQVVQRMQAPIAPMATPAAPSVAQAPTTTRSFSVEPGQNAGAPRVMRSYSNEPTSPVYRAPMRSNRSGTPTYLLPRSDSRKHG
jgi:hypothetical protein